MTVLVKRSCCKSFHRISRETKCTDCSRPIKRLNLISLQLLVVHPLYQLIVILILSKIPYQSVAKKLKIGTIARNAVHYHCQLLDHNVFHELHFLIFFRNVNMFIVYKGFQVSVVSIMTCLA